MARDSYLPVFIYLLKKFGAIIVIVRVFFMLVKFLLGRFNKSREHIC